MLDKHKQLITLCQQGKYEEAKAEASKFGCNYCNDRHFSCDYFDINQPIHHVCKGFKLGRCFYCSIVLAKGEFVDGLCSDVFDWYGCDNFTGDYSE